MRFVAMVHVLGVAQFELQAGEQELLKEVVDCVVEGRRMPNGSVIVTDRRVVLLTPKGKPPAFWMRLFGPLLGRVAATMATPLAVSHAIKRTEFDVVEEAAGKMLVFRNKASGYAHVSFEVMSMTPFETWQRRMNAWVAGTLVAEPLPNAKVVT